MTFRSTSAEALGGDDYRITGDLEILGTTKPITIDLEFNGAAKDPFGNERVGFEGKAEILRSEFGLTWNAALETGGVLVSEKIKLNFDISAIKSAIADEVTVPVSADLEDGYGEAPETVATTISMTLKAGAAGGNIEDFTGDRARPLYDEALAVDRIRAARAAIDAGGEPFVLVGRTDVLLVGGSLDECVRRANAYLAAGADCAFVPGAADAATIGTLVRELDGPLNVVMGLTGNALSLDDLRALGVRRVTVGGSIARAMYGYRRSRSTSRLPRSSAARSSSVNPAPL
jgi:2-methylisocitrate lyase-like PEP mutase family enzyme